MRSARRIMAVFALVVAVTFAWRVLDTPGAPGAGRIGMNVWDRLFGPADQGPVDFGALVRRSTPNDALVAPDGLTPRARPDAPSPRWSVPPDTLRQRLRAVILADPNVSEVANAEGTHGDRFVALTPLLRFPDTIDALVLPDGSGGSTVALYSRSLVGRSDLGTNLKRLRAWLADPALQAGRVPGS